MAREHVAKKYSNKWHSVEKIIPGKGKEICYKSIKA